MKPQNKKAVKPIDFTALRLFSLSNYIFFASLKKLLTLSIIKINFTSTSLNRNFRFAQEIAHTQNIFFASLKKIVTLGNYKYHELKIFVNKIQIK